MTEATTKKKAAPGRRLWIYKLVLFCAAALVSLAIAEGALRLFEKANLGDRALTEDLFQTDQQLEYRLPAFALDHDANGFRNDGVPERAEIVVLGDSQTWGVNATRDQTWPKQLEKLTGRTVYNMGMGGYGTVHYLALTDKALALKPRTLIVGFYFGNDLYDAYRLTYNREIYTHLRGKDLPADIGVDTVGPRAQDYWNQEKTFYSNYGRATPGRWQEWLRGHTAIGRSIDRTGIWPSTDLQFKIGRAWAQAYPDRGAYFDGQGTRTVFTTAYRKIGLDSSDLRVAEGMRITKHVLPLLKERTDANGAHLLIVLIPTKETVYADMLRDRGQPLDATFHALIRYEHEARAEILSLCDLKGLHCLDAIPELSRALSRGEQIYPTSTESHPNPRGYQILAAIVSDQLTKMGW